MKHEVACEDVAVALQALEDAGLPHEKEALEASMPKGAEKGLKARGDLDEEGTGEARGGM